MKKTDFLNKIGPVHKCVKDSREMVKKVDESPAAIADPDKAKELLDAYTKHANNASIITKFAVKKLDETSEKMQEIYNQTVGTGAAINAGRITPNIGIQNRVGMRNALTGVDKSDKKAAAKNIGNALKQAKTKNDDGDETTESAYDNIEDIFGADYMYESAMSELEQMIDEL